MLKRLQNPRIFFQFNILKADWRNLNLQSEQKKPGMVAGRDSSFRLRHTGRTPGNMQRRGRDLQY